MDKNWGAPIKDWYNGDISAIEYGKSGYAQYDAVVEIGMLAYFYYDGHLFVQVLVRVVDPSTNQVLGRAKSLEYPKVNVIPALTLNDGIAFKQLVVNTGKLCIDNNLKDIGLMVNQHSQH